MYKAVASLAFALLVTGWCVRRRRRAHVSLMLTGMALDLVMVLWLELERGVIAKAAGEEAYTALAIAHIVSSSLAVVCYFPTLWLGWKLLRGRAGAATRGRHLIVAQTALVLRAVGFALMWSI